MTLSVLLKALCVDTSSIPSVIANSGYEPGFLVSFTASESGKSIPEINLYIPPGLQINGTENILGVKASANISASPSVGIYASISLSPLDAGGLFQIYRSSSERDKGPLMIADLRPPEHISVIANGYISVLGISVEGKLSITKQSMSTTIQGKILGIADASFTVTSSSNGPFSVSQFHASGHFESSFFSTIQSGIRDASKRVYDSASSAIDKAKHLVDRQKDISGEANKALNIAKNGVSQAKEEVNKEKGVYRSSLTN